MGLRRQDIDFDASTRQQLQRVGGKEQVAEHKTARSRRTLPMTPPVVAALKRRKTRQLEERLLAGTRWRGDERGLVFTSTIGTPLDSRNVTTRFQRLLSGAGLPHQRFHDLRHCAASLLLAGGVPPRTIMGLLGHSQISLTMNTYAHLSPAMDRDAADRMETFLAKPS